MRPDWDAYFWSSRGSEPPCRDCRKVLDAAGVRVQR